MRKLLFIPLLILASCALAIVSCQSEAIKPIDDDPNEELNGNQSWSTDSAIYILNTTWELVGGDGSAFDTYSSFVSNSNIIFHFNDEGGGAMKIFGYQSITEYDSICHSRLLNLSIDKHNSFIFAENEYLITYLSEDSLSVLEMPPGSGRYPLYFRKVQIDTPRYIGLLLNPTSFNDLIGQWKFVAKQGPHSFYESDTMGIGTMKVYNDPSNSDRNIVEFINIKNQNGLFSDVFYAPKNTYPIISLQQKITNIIVPVSEFEVRGQTDSTAMIRLEKQPNGTYFIEKQ